MKKIKIGKLSVSVCQHKGDITYERFVKFKQYAPQFWEKMDSPLFQVYYEGMMDLFNQGKYFQMVGKLNDYRLAIHLNNGDQDAWGVCFALITGIEQEDMKHCPNDAEIKDKLDQLKAQGLTYELVEKEVVNFMKLFPETFTDHLVLYELLSSKRETGQ